MAIISDGTTIADAGAFSVGLGSMTHIKTLTASGSATLSFVNGTDDVDLDSTYPIYKFVFTNIHPSASSELYFNGSTDTGSNYNVTKTTAVMYAYHSEQATTPQVTNDASADLAQSTAFSNLNFASQIGTDNDNCGDGELWLFNPSSTTYVKHFMSRVMYMDARGAGPYMYDCYTSGYCNTTSAVDAVQFKMGSGNIDAGKIKLYGLKDS